MQSIYQSNPVDKIEAVLENPLDPSLNASFKAYMQESCSLLLANKFSQDFIQSTCTLFSRAAFSKSKTSKTGSVLRVIMGQVGCLNLLMEVLHVCPGVVLDTVANVISDTGSNAVVVLENKHYVNTLLHYFNLLPAQTLRVFNNAIFTKAGTRLVLVNHYEVVDFDCGVSPHNHADDERKAVSRALST